MNAQQHLQAHRAQKDAFFKSHPNSPLTDEQKAKFTSLVYFDYNPALHLTVEVKPFAEKKDVQIQTTTGELRWYRRYGEFEFDVEGQTARLTVYQTPHGFFLPFVDALAGKETYPAGRYLDIEANADGLFEIDFNHAYNPYCAYGDGWSCPITPAENRLKVAIQAGEKIPQGAWVESA